MNLSHLNSKGDNLCPSIRQLVLRMKTSMYQLKIDKTIIIARHITKTLWKVNFIFFISVHLLHLYSIQLVHQFFTIHIKNVTLLILLKS